MYNKLGTYDTWDLPNKTGGNNQEICDWVNQKAGKKIAWIKLNEHDFGPYESLEIDYPEQCEEGEVILDELEEDFDDLCEEDKKLVDAYLNWLKDIEKLYNEYNEKWL